MLLDEQNTRLDRVYHLLIENILDDLEYAKQVISEAGFDPDRTLETGRKLAEELNLTISVEEHELVEDREDACERLMILDESDFLLAFLDAEQNLSIPDKACALVTPEKRRAIRNKLKLTYSSSALLSIQPCRAIFSVRPHELLTAVKLLKAHGSASLLHLCGYETTTYLCKSKGISQGGFILQKISASKRNIRKLCGSQQHRVRLKSKKA